MKSILTAALAVSLLGSTAVMAQSVNQNQTDQTDRHGMKDRKNQNNAANPANSAVSPTAASRIGHKPVPPAAVPTVTPATPVRQVVRRRTTPTTPAGSASQAVPFALDRLRSPALQNKNVRTSSPRWTRGDRLPEQYRQNQYVVGDWQQHGLRKPPRGYHWVRDDNNDFFLALIATGVISSIVARDDRDRTWDQHYSRTYTYNDDVYYQQCRTAPDPAGVLIGGIIGGLLGNAAGRGNSGATIAGVIFGGAVGAALTSNLDCEDRSYAYKTYYDGFNSGRTGSRYNWRNPHNDHRGEFRIGSYYNDSYGFRCARFTQVTYIQGDKYNAKGTACRQPDGSWAVVN
jgi:Ni/Co efflux regulator RcnB/surface antigen